MGSGREVIGVFLQARLDSRRLPQKALLPLAGMTVIEHAMASLIDVEADVHAVLTDEQSADALQPYAEKWGFRVFPGDAEDVLLRFVHAADRYGVTTIIRATGDNPLVSRYLAEDILDQHLSAEADYSGYLGMPLGTGVEILNADSLRTAEEEASDPYEREHVSPFLYRHPERFTIYRPSVTEEFAFSGARVTLDTEKDYHLLQEIFDDLYTLQPIETDRLVEWLTEKQGMRVIEQVPI